MSLESPTRKPYVRVTITGPAEKPIVEIEGDTYDIKDTIKELASKLGGRAVWTGKHWEVHWLTRELVDRFVVELGAIAEVKVYDKSIPIFTGQVKASELRIPECVMEEVEKVKTEYYNMLKKRVEWIEWDDLRTYAMDMPRIAYAVNQWRVLTNKPLVDFTGADFPTVCAAFLATLTPRDSIRYDIVIGLLGKFLATLQFLEERKDKPTFKKMLDFIKEKGLA